MIKILNGKYIELTQEEIEVIEQHQKEYEETKPTQEPTIEERLTETENNVTELQMALCDIYEGMSDNG